MLSSGAQKEEQSCGPQRDALRDEAQRYQHGLFAHSRCFSRALRARRCSRPWWHCTADAGAWGLPTRLRSYRQQTHGQQWAAGEGDPKRDCFPPTPRDSTTRPPWKKNRSPKKAETAPKHNGASRCRPSLSRREHRPGTRSSSHHAWPGVPAVPYTLHRDRAAVPQLLPVAGPAETPGESRSTQRCSQPAQPPSVTAAAPGTLRHQPAACRAPNAPRSIPRGTTPRPRGRSLHVPAVQPALLTEPHVARSSAGLGHPQPVAQPHTGQTPTPLYGDSSGPHMEQSRGPPGAVYLSKCSRT